MSATVGVGVSTNFGLNKTRIKLFAYSTIGFGIIYNSVTAGLPGSYSFLEKETTDNFKL